MQVTVGLHFVITIRFMNFDSRIASCKKERDIGKAITCLQKRLMYVSDQL